MLSQVSLTLNTRGRWPEIVEYTSRPLIYVDVLDSTIEAESVLAIADFFANIGTVPYFSVCPRTGFSLPVAETNVLPSAKIYLDRWDDVCKRVMDILKPHMIVEPFPSFW